MGTTVFHENVFYEYFKLDLHPEAQYEISGGHGLETFGDVHEIVRSHDPAFVWTVIDEASGDDQWIIRGAHFVNRICYLTTKILHNGFNVKSKISRRLQSLDRVGFETPDIKVGEVNDRIARRR